MHQRQRDELNEHLKQLALAAQQHHVLTQGRQLALSRLIHDILRSGKLCRPYQGRFPGVYQDIYDEALQDLLLHICQHIDKYNPERGEVLAWCNTLLERRFFKEAIPKVIDKQGIKKMSLSDLENLVSVEESPPDFSEILRQYIESDPENLFRNNYISKQPKANFQALVKRRLMGQTWKEIAAEFNLEISTVSSFYYRCLTKFGEQLKECCNEHVV